MKPQSVAIHNHQVQFYEDRARLYAATTKFFAEGNGRDDLLLMLGTQETLAAVTRHVAPERIQFLEARQTLATLSDGDRVDPTRVRQLFMGFLSDIRTAGKPARVFGEMVDLLCAGGRFGDAICLEKMWNEQCFHDDPISTICGYGLDHFDDDAELDNLRSVCAQHSRLLPVGAFSHLVEHGLGEHSGVLLQQRARRLTIYVVDDDASVRRSLGRLLKASHLRVRTFESAEDFFAKVTNPTNGCLLLDVQMVGMSGPELQVRLRELGWRLPVIAMSGSADPRVELEALRLGATAFLWKPFGARGLFDAIAGLL